MGRFERQFQRQHWRELHNPFDFHKTQFIKLYRVTPDIMDVTDAIRERLEHGRLGALTPEHQVCKRAFNNVMLSNIVNKFKTSR